MRVQNFVDLSRVDVLSSSNDHVALAIHDVEVSFFIFVAEVPGVKPSRTKGLLGCRCVLVVALHNVRAAQHDLSYLPRPKLIVGVIKDPHLVADRQTYRPRTPAVTGRIKGRTARRLR